MRRIGFIISIVAIGIAIGGYVFFNGERTPPIRYRTASVERGHIFSVVSATGTINPVVSVQVGTQVSGMIKSLHADFNSRVKAGDTVAIIDPEPFKARREQAASSHDGGEDEHLDQAVHGSLCFCMVFCFRACTHIRFISARRTGNRLG